MTLVISCGERLDNHVKLLTNDRQTRILNIRYGIDSSRIRGYQIDNVIITAAACSKILQNQNYDKFKEMFEVITMGTYYVPITYDNEPNTDIHITGI